MPYPHHLDHLTKEEIVQYNDWLTRQLDRQELAFEPEFLPCDDCADAYDRVPERQVTAVGPETHFGLVQTYLLECGHYAGVRV